MTRNAEIVPHHDTHADVHAPSVKPAKPDDLKIVEGIGPKIEKLLNARGVWTFKQLAHCKPEWIKEVLHEAGPNFVIHDPGTWPQQSGLAADGKWDELETLQKKLTGGR